MTAADFPPSQETTDSRPRIEKTVAIDASPDRIYEAWADPALIGAWFVERAVGRAERGGRVTWIWERFGLAQEQEVLEAEPGRRLVLRSAPHDGPAQVVEVSLGPERGGTRLRLVHSGFASGAGDPTFDGVDSGWTLALRLLRFWAERHYGRPKEELLVLRPVRGACERVRPFYSSVEGRARWLVAEEGLPLEGETLEVAGPEVLRSWDEGRGTLELKAFARDRMECHVGVRAVSWRREPEDLEAFRPAFERPVDRLVEALA